jgi:hypothetical protein
MSSEEPRNFTSRENADSEKPEIVIDEDWKERIKAEDAALDQKIQEEKKNVPQSERQGDVQTGQGEGDSSGTTGGELEMPPASFSSLVGMFTTQAMVGLGVIPNPISGKAEPQLKLARHFIDLLSIIEEKTNGNLEADEIAMLNSTLHQLRTMFLQQSKAATQTTSGDAQSSSMQTE